MTRAWRVVFAMAVARALALVHRGQAIGWDELEFFRATKWAGEGLVPYRDFWEHHTPLQWMLFAPIASLFADGAGAASIVIMRYAQLALWIAIFVIVLRLAKTERWPALVFLLASTSFIHSAIEYRVDVLGNLLFLAAAMLVFENRDRWITFGVLLAAAVLANIRLAPMVAVLALYALWRVRLRALRMIVGALAVVGVFAGYMTVTHAWPGFVEGLIRYNTTSARLLEVHTFFDTLLAPVWALDVAGVALWLFAIAGCVVAVRANELLLPLLFVASILTIAMMEVQYEYHFQLTQLLMVPLAALAFARLAPKWQPVAALVAGAALVIAFVQLVPRFGAAMEYQDAVMRSADRLTSPNESVFDGAGYALRRKPAYRYWFLTTGVRMMAAAGIVPRYDFARNPPGAVIADYRLQLYVRSFPELARDVVRNSVPLYRNLWIPGMTATIGPRAKRLTWRAAKAGTYDVWASELLLRHPWFTRPLDYGTMPGDFPIPLARLPRAAATLTWRVDGVALPAGTRTLVLRKGSLVELDAVAPAPAGVLVVPRGIGTLAISPEDDEVVF